MAEMEPMDQWPSLCKDDKGLEADIRARLTERVVGNAYGRDSQIADQIALLPVGLRAMAATHFLDISLTLDSITWHFGNFGEPRLVALTEAGLRELDLIELADCFHQAAELIQPLMEMRTEEDAEFYDYLEKHGIREQAEALDNQGWDLGNLANRQSAIYAAWVRYARLHPENVFA